MGDVVGGVWRLELVAPLAGRLQQGARDPTRRSGRVNELQREHAAQPSMAYCARFSL
jgi:hypothetical protein